MWFKYCAAYIWTSLSYFDGPLNFWTLLSGPDFDVVTPGVSLAGRAAVLSRDRSTALARRENFAAVMIQNAPQPTAACVELFFWSGSESQYNISVMQQHRELLTILPA